MSLMGRRRAMWLAVLLAVYGFRRCHARQGERSRCEHGLTRTRRPSAESAAPATALAEQLVAAVRADSEEAAAEEVAALLACGVALEQGDRDGQLPLISAPNRRRRGDLVRPMGPEDGPVMLRHMQIQAKRLDAWEPKAPPQAPPGVRGRAAPLEPAGSSTQLIQTTRALLNLFAASLLACAANRRSEAGDRTREDASAEFSTVHRSVRGSLHRKLHLGAVSYAVREFVSSLLYVAVMSEAQRDSLGKSSVEEVIYEMCGAVHDDAVELANEKARSATVPCSMCVCCHLGIQEALSLLRFLHKSLSGHCSPFTSEQLPKYLEDGVLLLLRILINLSSFLHEGCYLTAHQGNSMSSGYSEDQGR
ncbi:unnamed protein product [Durusdinium trenchii]|uniref:Uncharacterized protein n=1 Tax=Durusdinium trenchii TaxID=1381693 RepID=A0ABP0Q980_9DINO